MALTTAEITKVKEMIKEGGMVEKLLLKQTKLDEIKVIIEEAKPDIESKKAEIKALEDIRDGKIQTINVEIGALGLG